MTPTTTGINTSIPPCSTRSVEYNPGVPVYTLKISNQHHKELIVAVTYDRATGVLCVTVAEV